MPDMPPEHLYLDRYASPIGEILLVTDEHGVLRALDFHDHEPRMLRLLRLHYGPKTLEPGAAPAPIRQALDAYFAGDREALQAIAWRTGGTAFQRAVWAGLAAIPAGETLSYGQLAARLGNPKAVRAVGLVVPCHRVIGANGSMTGYAGGLERKRWLLKHEGGR